MNRAEKMKMLAKFIKAGFDSEEKIKKFDFREIKKVKLTQAETYAVADLKDAVIDRRLISYLADNEDEKEGDEKAVEAKAETAAPQKEVISKDVTKHKDVPVKAPAEPTFLHGKE